VVFGAFVFFIFVALVFFAFVAFVVSCPAVSCANTGIANEKAIMPVKSSVKSFFMLGLDLLKNCFRRLLEQTRVQIPVIMLESYNSMETSKLL